MLFRLLQWLLNGMVTRVLCSPNMFMELRGVYSGHGCSIFIKMWTTSQNYFNYIRKIRFPYWRRGEGELDGIIRSVSV